MRLTDFEVIQHTRKTDRPGVFANGFGLEEMRAGDVTYIVVNNSTGLYYQFCTREPFGVWVDPDSEDWVRDKEQTAVAYDWFEKMQ